MRRAKPISVRVRAPSRGLVTRLPGESADQMPAQGGIAPGTLQRAASVASNVRYEDGVVCNAPGYERISVSSATLSGLVAQWHLDELQGVRSDASGNGHSLTEVPGYDSLAGGQISVTSEVGKIGRAALFTPALYHAEMADRLTTSATLDGGYINPLPVHSYDGVTLDASLASGFYSPRVQYPHDSSKLDAALDSGTYTATVVTSTALADRIATDSTLLSGTFAQTVLGVQSVSDNVSTDSTLLSGVYTAVMVVAPTVADRVALDVSVSGSYVQTVPGTQSSHDRMTLTASLDSGSYS
jgi:hypothetical protein